MGGNGGGPAQCVPGPRAGVGRGPGGRPRYLDRCHGEALAIFGGLSDADLLAPCENPSRASVPIWKWLRAMTEHEAHHRGQLYLMASLRGRSVVPLFGLTRGSLPPRSSRKTEHRGTVIGKRDSRSTGLKPGGGGFGEKRFSHR